MINQYNCIIVANGSFPTSPELIGMLRRAATVVACDGATESLCRLGIFPSAIVGDMDSLPDDLRRQFHSCIHHIAEQDTNDLTKAVRFVRSEGHRQAMIMGATGMREDHTAGNISLLLEYAGMLDCVEIISDFGLFTPLLHSATLASYRGQQVSIFTPRHGVKITTSGLRWPIENRLLTSWWEGTLNESVADTFTVTLSGEDYGAVIYRQLKFPLS